MQEHHKDVWVSEVLVLCYTALLLDAVLLLWGYQVGQCIFHGCLPLSPWEGCHSVHVKPATQSMGTLPPSPREACHVDHGKVATQSRRRLPPSEHSDAGR